MAQRSSCCCPGYGRDIIKNDFDPAEEDAAELEAKGYKTGRALGSTFQVEIDVMLGDRISRFQMLFANIC